MFIFNYTNYLMGGIELYNYDLMELLIKEKRKVVLIVNEKSMIFEGFKDIINSYNVQFIRVKNNRFSWFKIIDKINFYDRKKVVIFSYSVFDFIKSQKFKRKFKKIAFNSFFVVPHFANDELYIERAFDNIPIIKKVIKRKQAQILLKIYNNNAMLFFNKKHAESYMENYNINFKNYEKHMILDICNKFIDMDMLKVRALRKELIILSAGRFEFPHKGYILGIVDSFSKILTKFENAKLIIVGSGAGEEKLLKKISNLDILIQSKITLKKSMSFKELLVLANECTINISAAGCCSKLAEQGILSLVCRHYSNQCECYGFYSDAKSKILSSDTGTNVYKFIEQVMEMSDDEYINKSIEATNEVQTSSVNIVNEYFDINESFILNFFNLIWYKLLDIPFKILVSRRTKREYKNARRKVKRKDD